MLALIINLPPYPQSLRFYDKEHPHRSIIIILFLPQVKYLHIL